MTAKEKSVIAYISDYLFGTIYWRIRFSKSSQENSRSIYHQQYLSFLATEKCKDENLIYLAFLATERSMYDSGDLWKVNKDVVAIFSVVEAFFLILNEKSIK